ncbi:MAG: hypothetical protein WKI04_07535 [Ferruginibacter sp.]
MFNNWKVIALLIILTLLIGKGSKEQAVKKTGGKPATISLVDELEPLYQVSGLAAYRENTIDGQVSSYDTTGGNDDGFNGKFSFIRRNADSSLVIFDIKGSGVINRFATPTPTQDTLDFYIDDTLHPAFSIKYTDLFSGKIFPFIQPLCGNQLGGYFCYFPILFNKSCRIVCRGKKMQFHQLQYRLFQEGTNVKSFNLTLDEPEKNALQKTVLFWNKEEKNIALYWFGIQGSYGLRFRY